jgi:cbb3-type cytochrome oxidase maturation protein
MAILLVLVPISLILLGVAVWAFVWAVRSGQYDDLDTQAIDVLLDDAETPSAASRARGGRDDAD